MFNNAYVSYYIILAFKQIPILKSDYDYLDIKGLWNNRQRLNFTGETKSS